MENEAYPELTDLNIRLQELESQGYIYSCSPSISTATLQPQFALISTASSVPLCPATTVPPDTACGIPFQGRSWPA